MVETMVMSTILKVIYKSSLFFLMISLDAPSSKLTVLLFFKWILYFYFSTAVFCASISHSVLT